MNAASRPPGAPGGRAERSTLNVPPLPRGGAGTFKVERSCAPPRRPPGRAGTFNLERSTPPPLAEGGAGGTFKVERSCSPPVPRDGREDRDPGFRESGPGLFRSSRGPPSAPFALSPLRPSFSHRWDPGGRLHPPPPFPPTSVCLGPSRALPPQTPNAPPLSSPGFPPCRALRGGSLAAAAPPGAVARGACPPLSAEF